MSFVIDNLRIEFTAGASAPPTTVVDGLSLSIAPGRTAALVGESGCGKSVTSLAVLRLLPRAARITAGRILLDDLDLVRAGDAQLRAVRGNRIGIIFQEPMSSLNPVITIGRQIAESIELHRGLSAADARRRTIELLDRVRIPAAARRVDDYPHQLSGGMRQRVMIAMALACEPELLIADEPTTALDVTVQAQIIDLLRELQASMGLAVLFITHDLALASQFAHDAYVMYAGRIVESGPAADVFSQPSHPYTRALLRSLPRHDGPIDRATPLPVIPGEVPRPWRRPGGCAFHPRCDEAAADPRCTYDPPRLVAHDRRAVACWHRE